MRRVVIIALVMLFVVSISLMAGDHAFVGAKKCGMCHKGPKKGEIKEKWEGGPHAGAYNSLGTPEAAEVYKKLGKSGNPQEDDNCLSCHVTGHGMDAALTDKLVKENGVSCESCHGAGADYAKMKTMKDKAASIAGGMVEDPKKGCVNCHNDQSPTYKEFVLETFWKKIEHKKP